MLNGKQNQLKKVLNRIYSDYLMPSRLDEYESILTTALEKGYKHLSLIEFSKLISSGNLNPDDKYFIHRHDIDTDVSTAKKMFEIEKKHNIKSSYYFRLSTLDYNLMNEINDFGSEASYHFEELAQYCKDNRIKSKEKVLEVLDTIREIFKNNYLQIENKLGYKLYSVASHGDFINRKLGITNSILINHEIRNQLDISVEGYDALLLKNYSIIMSDAPYPVFYKPTNPFLAIENNYQVIYLLTHPRHWHTNVLENTKDNLNRLYEGFKYSI